MTDQKKNERFAIVATPLIPLLEEKLGEEAVEQMLNALADDNYPTVFSAGAGLVIKRAAVLDCAARAELVKLCSECGAQQYWIQDVLNSSDADYFVIGVDNLV